MERIPYKSKEQKLQEKKRLQQNKYFAQKKSQESYTAYRLKQMFRED